MLIVEDDEDVRDSTVALLGELGYSVLAARNGDEALVRLQGSERIDILFTDVVLPQGMNGRALALEASALRPGLPVLFTTGYARNAIIRNGGLDPAAHFSASPTRSRKLRKNCAQRSMPRLRLEGSREGRMARTLWAGARSAMS